MKAFTFVRPDSANAASEALFAKGSVLKAAGVDLLDRMKERIDEPDHVVWLGDVKDADMRRIDVIGDRNSSLRIGALVTIAEIAESRDVRKLFPALATAAGLAASPQIRQRATLAGNLLQHTRCGYYRHGSFPCFKRGDAACPVLDDVAVQDTAAIFSNRPCASAHPSSLAPVLAACHTSVWMWGGDVIPFREFYGAPVRGRAADVALKPGAVVTHVDIEVPHVEISPSAYEEVRQKSAFDWALASCCVVYDRGAGNIVMNPAVWLGSVAPTPWHAEAAEKALVGKTLDDATIAAAADAAVLGATPLPGNAYKVDLVKVVVRRALTRLRDMR
jgi:xanthine dehydrogenase YagS FAD-binding subunit